MSLAGVEFTSMINKSILIFKLLFETVLFTVITVTTLA